MGKALHGLVYVILVLSIVALVFANMLFGKRELLMKRNQALEDQVISLAKTFEAKDAEEAAAPELSKDASEVSDRELDNPEKENLLDGYPAKLEQQNLATMNLSGDKDRLQMRQFYAVGADGKYVLDPVTQKPSTKGAGTMKELMDKVLDRAKAQQANLNKTRAELTKKREQLSDVVAEFNKLKVDGRTTKKDLTATKQQVADLTTKNEALEGRIVRLNAEKKELSAELADCKNENEKLVEDKTALTEDLASSKKTIKELTERLKGAGDRPAPGTEGSAVAITQLTAGDKGKIIAANDDLKFCIVEFSKEAIAEMLGPDRQKALPQLEMNIRRVGRSSAAGDFVTRIKLRQAVRGKDLVVADILNDWQQAPVEKGDVVFF